jgi:maleylacetoacetate isomerase/maleylpyruvate isomerase
MNLVLYHYWRSTSSWRVRFALHHKGLPYESRFVNLRASEQRSAEHKRLSPLGVVPCLLVDGKALCESVAILEYLEDVSPDRPLLPREAWHRARVRQLVELVNSGIQPLQNLVVQEHLSSDEGVRHAWVRHFNERGLVALESALLDVEREFGRGRYSFGDELTLADVYLVPQVATAIRFQLALEPFPNVRRIFEACMQLDAAIQSSPENQADAPKKS